MTPASKFFVCLCLHFEHKLFNSDHMASLFLYLATPTNTPISSADWVVVSLPTLLPSWENTDWVRVCTQLRHNSCYINQSSDVEQIYFQLNYKFIFSEIWQTGSEHTRKIRPGVLKAEGFSLVIIRMIRHRGGTDLQ